MRREPFAGPYSDTCWLLTVPASVVNERRAINKPVMYFFINILDINLCGRNRQLVFHYLSLRSNTSVMTGCPSTRPTYTSTVIVLPSFDSERNSMFRGNLLFS